MGVFSRKEHTPEPQISIHLDDASESTRFQPGSPVRGTVSLQSPITRQLLGAQVCLFGRATTHSIRKVRHHSNAVSDSGTRTVYVKYHGEAQFFRICQKIAGYVSLELGKEIQSQFSFIFPTYTEAVTGEVPYTRESTYIGVYAVDTHALPPAFSHFQSPDDYATIEYRLQVVAYFSERPEPFIHNSTQPLVFSPLPAPHQPGLMEFVRPSQNYASSRLLGEEKSIGKSLRDKLSSKTPSVEVVMKASFPVCVPTATGFTLPTCIEIGRISHPSIKIPSATISIKSLKLVPITAWRALKVEHSGHMSGYSQEHEAVDEETVRLNAIPSAVTAEGRGVGKGDILAFPASFEARVPGSVCPTFRTLIINRSYILKVTMEAEICGKVFELKVEHRMVILSDLKA